MTSKIFPSRLPNPVTPLGYDNSDFMAVGVVRKTGMNWGVRRTRAIDRNATRVSEDYEGTVGDHEWTERISYTVASGHHAVIQLIGFGFGAVAEGGQVRWRVKVGGVMVWAFIADSTIPFWLRYDRMSVNFEMLANETISMETYNNLGVGCYYIGHLLGIEYDA